MSIGEDITDSRTRMIFWKVWVVVINASTQADVSNAKLNLTRADGNPYWMIISFGSCFLLTLLEFSFEILHIYSFIIFGNSSKLVVETCVIKNSENQHVRWRNNPHISCIDGIGKGLYYASQILRGTSSDCDSRGMNWFVWSIEV